MQSRLFRALLGYLCLAVLAAITLDGRYLAFVLILMAALALKSWIAAKRDQQP